MPDATGLRGALVAARGETAVSDGQMRRMTEERDMTLQEIANADELFMTNALFGIWPVAALDDRTLARGPVTQRLMRHLGLGPDA